MPAKGVSVPTAAALPSSDVIVVGGGAIGLAIAWRSALRGLAVIVVDDEPGGGASHFAAGMLAPVTEVHYGEEDLLQLNLAAARRYPSFVAELEEASRTTVGYRECGTLAIAFDADDKAALADLQQYQASLGLASTPLTSRECRALEPYLAPSVRGGLLVEGDHQVDNRRLVRALLAACDRAGVQFHRQRATEIVVDRDRVVGVDDLRGEHTVLAAGCWSGDLKGLPSSALPPVRPVKGQILRLHDNPMRPLIGHNVRAIVRGRPIYLVPRESGEIVLGATSEELGFDQTVTVGGVSELLADARELIPGIAELALAESSAGLRPGSPDNAPMIGPSELAGLVIATGHYRNGILLTPVTADGVAELLATGALPGEFERFDPRRFGDIATMRVSAASAR
ncbi:MAG: glycine oxidase ThiO [Acidothermaceae bacterium]